MASERRVIRPNPGPQETFLSTPADIALYGGSAGSGKTFAVVLDPLRHVHRPGFSAIVLRREATRLVGGGSIWSESQGLYPLTGASSRESPALEWRWPSGASLEMRHLQHEKDVHAHQGKQYAAIYFEEVCEFSEAQFWYLLSRLRTTCGIRPYVRATCNPDPDSFVRRLIAWWIGADGYPIAERSGALRWLVRSGDDLLWYDTRDEARAAYPSREPLSVTFIAASLADNPKGDPTYRDKLDALPRVERERLLLGNWDVRASAGSYFRRPWFRVVEHRPAADAVKRRVRFWDLAATEQSAANPDPDWTVGALVAELKDGSYVVEHVERFRGSPGRVLDAVRAIGAQDGRDVTIGLWQDPGQAGKAQVDAYLRALVGHKVRAVKASQNKVTYAEVWSPRVEAGHVALVRGPWLEPFFTECESFPEGAHDDQIDAVSGAFQALSKAYEVASFKVAI